MSRVRTQRRRWMNGPRVRRDTNRAPRPSKVKSANPSSTSDSAPPMR